MIVQRQLMQNGLVNYGQSSHCTKVGALVAAPVCENHGVPGAWANWLSTMSAVLSGS